MRRREHQSGFGTTVLLFAVLAVNNNALSMSFLIAGNPDVNGPPSVIPNGTTQKLTNGINLWTPTGTTATHPTNTTGQTVCPVLQIVNANKTHLSYALSNGK